MNEYFYYIVTGETPNPYPRGAQVFKTPMNWNEFKEYVRDNTTQIHECGSDRVFKHGLMEFINPEIKMVEDFKNYLPFIIET